MNPERKILVLFLFLLLGWSCASLKDGMTKTEYRDAVKEKIERQDLRLTVGRYYRNKAIARGDGDIKYLVNIRIYRDSLIASFPREYFDVTTNAEIRSLDVCCLVMEREQKELPNGCVEVRYKVGENLWQAFVPEGFEKYYKSPVTYRFIFGPWNLVKAEIDGTNFYGELEFDSIDNPYHP